jgi:cell division septal protein FtsQ
MRPAATRTATNRSQQVRQRRNNRSRSRVEKAASSISAPQVTVRGEGLGRPILPRTSSRPRRVYTVAFQNTGRAYSVPAPTIRLGWRALSGLLVAGLIALIFFALNSEQFKVEKPVIEGATRVSVNDIEAVLKFNGRSVFTIDPFAARIELEKSFPELQQVSVLVGFPNQVSVSFSERTPVLAWKVKDQTLWIDAQGTIFNARGAPDNSAKAAPQPVLMDPQIMDSALLLSGHMPKNTNLVYSEKEGLGWHDSRGWDVYFGKTLDDLEMKISMYQAIIDQLNQKGITPSYVNLEFLNAPYYRVEP